MNNGEARIRVRYAETDQMGVVYHANYVVWMEVGRVELCRSRGMNYRDLEAEGILLTVAEVNCRYLRPALYDDEVIIATEIVKSHPRMVVFGYRMIRASNGELLATGESKHVFCDRNLQATKIPARYFALFGIDGGA